MLREIFNKQNAKPIIITAIITALFLKGVQSDPLEAREYTKYRVVYSDGRGATNKYMLSKEDGSIYSSTFGFCGESVNMSKWFWYGEEFVPGVFGGKWVSMNLCGTTEEVARNGVEAALKRRLESEKSKTKVFQAYITKEDVVKFEIDEKKVAN